jgi:hypothetical protein
MSVPNNEHDLKLAVEETKHELAGYAELPAIVQALESDTPKGPSFDALARNIASELAIGDNAQVLAIIRDGLEKAYNKGLAAK